MGFTKLNRTFKAQVAPDRMFKALILDSHNLLPKLLFSSIENMELIEGDGDLGSIKQTNFTEVSELGPEVSGRNIVEIIFKSSWLNKDNPICKIERTLKVHNTQRTIQRFEDCRDAVKIRALASTRKNPRCAADGNELLRFHCTALDCSLGDRGSILCCGVCTAIRHGFQPKHGARVRTTASSGRAQDSLHCADRRRAMLVCRVIAGRVRRTAPAADENSLAAEEGAMSSGAYDSIAGCAGAYSNLEELFVLNPRDILPCFVVIYKAL